MKKLSKKIVFVALLLVGGTAVGYALSSDNVVKAEGKPENKVELKLANKTWYFVGNAGDSRTDATKYSLVADEDRPCGDKLQEVCSLSAPDDGTGHPDMNAIVSGTQTVSNRISAAFPSGSTPTTNETVTALRAISE